MSELPREIQKRLAKLDALEAGGVDKWEWYSASLNELRAFEQKEESAQNLADEICEIICTEIDEPAGSGCGYGVTGVGLEQIADLILSKVEKFK